MSLTDNTNDLRDRNMLHTAPMNAHNLYTHTHSHIHTHTCTLTHTHSHMHTHTCTLTCTHPTYTKALTHIQVPL